MALNAIIDLMLNSAQFDTALDKSEKRIKGFAREAEKAGKIAGKISTGLNLANISGLEKLASGSKLAKAGIEGLTGAMMLLGAVPIPIAIGVAAAGALATFVLRGSEAEKQAEELAQRLDRLKKSAVSLATTAIDLDQLGASKEVQKLEQSLADLNAQRASLASGLNEEGQRTSSALAQLDQDIREATVSLAAWQGREKLAFQEGQRIRKEFADKAAESADKRAGAEESASARTLKALEAERRARQQMAEADAAAVGEKANAQLAAARDLIRDIGSEEDKFNLIIEELTEKLEAGTMDLATFNARVAEAQGKLMDALQQDAQETTKQVSLYADQAARNSQSAFADFLFDPFSEGLDGMLRGFIDVIRRMIAEAAAAKIFEGSGGFFDGILGAIGLGKLPGRASGGPVSSGKAYMVGEKGPEMFVPGRSGTIVPNGAGGGMSVVVNIDARNATDPAAIFAAGKVLERQVLGKVATFMRRGYMPA